MCSFELILVHLKVTTVLRLNVYVFSLINRTWLLNFMALKWINVMLRKTVGTQCVVQFLFVIIMLFTKEFVNNWAYCILKKLNHTLLLWASVRTLSCYRFCDGFVMCFIMCCEEIKMYSLCVCISNISMPTAFCCLFFLRHLGCLLHSFVFLFRPPSYIVLDQIRQTK